MKSYHGTHAMPDWRLLGLAILFCFSGGRLAAQELEPPSWSIGDWWILNCQMYEAGQVVPATEPRWLPPQTWHFQVEGREMLENQAYFVVAVRPRDGNPSPYWFRFWFRESDRYVGRYELRHPEQAATKHTHNLDAAAVRKNFDPTGSLPFLTSKLPALPLTLPLFAEVRQLASRSVSERSVRSVPAPYVGPEFELSQDVRVVDANTPAAKAPADVALLGTSAAEQMVLITIRTTTSVIEEQYWQPQFPWCVYGQRLENSVITRRYWLVETGRN